MREVGNDVTSGGERRCCVEVDRGSGFGLVGGSVHCTYREGQRIVVYVRERYVGARKVVARTEMEDCGGVVRGGVGIRTSCSVW